MDAATTGKSPWLYQLRVDVSGYGTATIIKIVCRENTHGQNVRLLLSLSEWKALKQNMYKLQNLLNMIRNNPTLQSRVFKITSGLYVDCVSLDDDPVTIVYKSSTADGVRGCFNQIILLGAMFESLRDIMNILKDELSEFHDDE